MTRPRQFTNAQVLKAIQAATADSGRPPTVEELRQILGVGSTRTALRYLQSLEEAGDIERWPGARGLRIRRAPGKSLRTVSVPIVGRAPAGAAILAEQNIEGWLRVPVEFLGDPSQTYFLLRVQGSSMNRCRLEGSLIENGDILLVRSQSDAQSGDVVVALIDGEATIKKLSKGSDFALLRPQSSEPVHQPIMVTEGFQIQGKARRVFKRGSDLLEEIFDEGD